MLTWLVFRPLRLWSIRQDLGLFPATTLTFVIVEVIVMMMHYDDLFVRFLRLLQAANTGFLLFMASSEYLMNRWRWPEVSIVLGLSSHILFL